MGLKRPPLSSRVHSSITLSLFLPHPRTLTRTTRSRLEVYVTTTHSRTRVDSHITHEDPRTKAHSRTHSRRLAHSPRLHHEYSQTPRLYHEDSFTKTHSRKLGQEQSVKNHNHRRKRQTQNKNIKKTVLWAWVGNFDASGKMLSRRACEARSSCHQVHDLCSRMSGAAD